MVLGVETWIRVDGDGVGDGEGVNSRVVSAVLNKVVHFLSQSVLVTRFANKSGRFIEFSLR